MTQSQMWDNLSGDRYTNPYSYIHHRINPEANKLWGDKEREIGELFHKEACESLKLDPDSKVTEEIFNKAYDDGHGFGLSDIYAEMVGLVDFLEKIGFFYPSEMNNA